MQRSKSIIIMFMNNNNAMHDVSMPHRKSVKFIMRKNFDALRLPVG